MREENLIVVLHCNRITLLIFMFVSFPHCAMVRPPQAPKLSQKSKISWNSLPADVRRYAMQFIASSNVYEVAETMKVLNATDKFCHDAMQSEQVVISIMERMPYLANGISLLSQLFRWPVKKRLESYEKDIWPKLQNGGELLDATRLNNTERVKALLALSDLQLNCHTGLTSETSLNIALQEGYNEIAIALIMAGATPDYLPLINPVKRNNSLLVALLLKFGADPNYTGGQVAFAHAEIKELIFDALKMKKKRMRLLCGKKDDGCTIT